MRETLFRGKRIDNGEWIEGFYWEGTSEPPKRYYIYDPDCDRAFRVDPKTVGQFTGLKDNIGERIFEGDKVEGRNGPCVVKWSAAHCGFRKVTAGGMILPLGDEELLLEGEE